MIMKEHERKNDTKNLDNQLFQENFYTQSIILIVIDEVSLFQG